MIRNLPATQQNTMILNSCGIRIKPNVGFAEYTCLNEPMGPDHKWRKWYQDILDFDPLPLLKEVSIPTIFIFGDPNLDRFSPVNQSIQNVISLSKQNKRV